MWLARDRNNTLYLYAVKPHLLTERGIWLADYKESLSVFEDPEENGVMYPCISLSDEIFPEVTFENSPKELVIK